ncbi:MAG: hypothetical protein M1838_000573 [Thelocarpon superellum]|nr:MAG: hypothetical protein M1838_000573 [Thelocarpon superellum]
MPPLEGDPTHTRFPHSYPSPAHAHSPGGPRLPPPGDDALRRGTLTPPMGPTSADSSSWAASRGIPMHRPDLPPTHAPPLGSPSRSETSPTSQPFHNPEHRSFTSYNAPPRPDPPFSLPEASRSYAREQLPPLSHLLPAESVASRSPYSSPWSTASPRSPRRSPVSGPASYEPPSLQASPFSDRSTARPPSFAAMPFHDAAARGHAHSIASFPSPPHGARDLAPPSAAYHERHRRDRYSDSVASGSSRWPPRSDPRAGLPPASAFGGPGMDRTSSTPSHSGYVQPSESPPTTSDAIGPSIWTGTHFLPRFVGERDVPGEGSCFFYDDGSHCKTIIDGEAVNAHWGVTKAGKPRKRLAVACLTCREKKIKCDPDYPKCVQCEKFGRICKFKNAPRGNRTSPEPFPAEGSDDALSSGHSTVKDAVESGPDVAEATPALPRESRDGPLEPRKRRSSGDMKRHMSSISDVDPLDVSQPNQYAFKKRRQSSPTDAQLPHLRPTFYDESERAARPSFPNDMFRAGILDHPSPFHWESDPAEINAELVQHLMELYFRHINSGTYCIFPRAPFLRWAVGCKDKSADDLMLLYTILTLASNFSGRADRKTFSKDFARIARYAIEHRAGRYSIQLAQSRLLLALYYHATNKPVDAWDVGGAAAATAVGLHLHLETPRSALAPAVETEYGLSPQGFAECRRRTFWTIYLMDRYNTVYSGNAPILQNADIFLRLPCDEATYDAQGEAENPTFEAYVLGRPPRQTPKGWRLGPMAHLVHISCIWGDVMAEIHRARHGSSEGYGERYAAFYDTIQERLEGWVSMLPPGLAYSRMNVDASIHSGAISIAVAMHALYHAAAIKLHRQVDGARMGRARVDRNLCALHAHALELLRMMRVIMLPREGESVVATRQPYATPFVGYAVTMACDVVSAKGRVSELPSVLEQLEGGLRVLGELRPHWSSARAQSSKIESRVSQLQDVLRGEGGDRDTVMAGAAEGPALDDTFCLSSALLGKSWAEDDLIYGSTLQTYLEALAGERKDSGSSTTGMISAMSLNAS